MMSKTVNCRICDQPIGNYGWPKHVEKHKREFVKATGVDESWEMVDWGEVVAYFRPENANPEKVRELQAKGYYPVDQQRLSTYLGEEEK